MPRCSQGSLENTLQQKEIDCLHDNGKYFESNRSIQQGVHGHGTHLTQLSSPSFHPHLAGQKSQSHPARIQILANDLRCPDLENTSTSNRGSDIAEHKGDQSTDHEGVHWSGYTNCHSSRLQVLHAKLIRSM